MIKPAFVFLFLLFGIGARCQKIDTAKVLLNSKMLLTEYLGEFGDNEYYHKFVEYTPPAKFLKSSGFDGRFLFYELEINETKYETPINDSMARLHSFFRNYYSGKVVFAFDVISEIIYRLAGFDNDDIREFLHFSFSTINLSGEKVNCKNVNRYFQIEGIDLKCLCKSKKTKCYPVLHQISTIAY